jgi:dipeptidyl aminopeptidase/acylaminoacyl peptidase
MTKLLSIAFVAFSAGTILWPSAYAQKVPPPAIEENSRIHFLPVANREQHVLTLQEIVETRRIREPVISPDGNAVAFIIERASLERNERRSGLYVVSADRGAVPVRLLEEGNISSIQWVQSGKYLTFLSSRTGSRQIWRVPTSGGEPEPLFSHPGGVKQYEFSPDGNLVAFIAADIVEDKENGITDDAKGIVFNRSASNGVYGWIARRATARPPEPVKLWIYDVRLEKAEKLELTIRSWRVDDRVGLTMVWSPDSRKLAVRFSRPANEKDISGLNHDIGVISLETRTYVPLVTWGGFNSGINWSPDSGSIAFVSQGGTGDKIIQKPVSLFVKNVKDGNLLKINLEKGHGKNILNAGWSKDGRRIFLEMGVPPGGERALYELNLKDGWTKLLSPNDEFLSAFTLSNDQTRAACIREGPTTLPEIAVLNLKSEGLNTLTDLHPEYRNIRLSKASKLPLKNKYGIAARCYFLKPLDYVEGRKYPLVVIFNHYAGQFMSDSLGNYPFQAFAASGHAVLAITGGQSEPYRFGDFREASVSWAYDPLASIEQAIETLVKMGIADPKRVGIMGWSYGNFLTNFAITQSNLFTVASSGDGSLFNMGSYWNVGAEQQKMYDGAMGGGPYGSTYKNWQQISPTLNADRVRIPVLLETTDTTIMGELEFYTAIEKQGGQSELVIYRNAIHEFNRGQPKQSFYSMQVNLDWFNFWLQGKEDPDPSKQQQYIRWRAMQDEFKKREASNGKNN